jgi:dihydrofolate reductase
MRLSAVLACDLNGGIGKDNALPWSHKIKADMRRFREVTMGKPCILGRRTWESIGKPLQGRTLIVVSRDTPYDRLNIQSGVLRAVSIEHALNLAATHGEEACVIGGEDIYSKMLPMCERVYLTVVEAEYDCDRFVPFSFQLELAHPGYFKIESSDFVPADGDTPALRFFDLRRI